MIIDFTVENFRSIKSEQLLSLYAENKPKHHAGNIAYVGEDLGVLKTCAIYGANAAGKTNIILAIDALKKLIVDSGDLKDGDAMPGYEPYLLSAATRSAPTRFEIEFSIEDVRYTYHIEFNQTEIIYERLDHYPGTRAANLFTRTSATDYKGMKFGEHYKGGKKQIAFFANNAYLSKAGNTPDSPPVARKVFNYFRQNLKLMLVNKIIGVIDWNKDERIVSIMNQFLKKVDLGIDKFEMEKQEGISVDHLPEGMPEAFKKVLLAESAQKEVFYHTADDGKLVRFEKDNESMGTNKLFKLLPFFIRILSRGAILFIDEIEGSFHPHIAALIIKLFNDPLVNKNNAQLIFTTHDLSLMSPETMRKDQIYLTEKSVENGTELDCLENYESTLKDSSPFAKWYSEGRLGGIPTIHYRDIADSIKEAHKDAEA
ncbi:MAG: AAA15 family ATPase/GTPase [Phenylobacterium sp.]|jgi:AAA15 family ATPase/GTPase